MTVPFVVTEHPPDDILGDNWSRLGITGGFAVNFPIENWLLASGSIDHTLFFYRQSGSVLPAFAVRDLGTSGNPAQITRLTATIKAHTTVDSLRRSQWFVMMGGGFVFEKLGRITHSWLNDDQSVTISRFTYPPANFLTAFFGFGTLIHLAEHLKLDVSWEFRYRISKWSILDDYSSGYLILQVLYDFSL